MKKRRTLIIALLLVAALALGIGYAAFSSEMLVNGEADLNATASEVKFTRAATTTGTTQGITVNPSGLDTKSLTLDVDGFIKKDEKAVIEIDITNPHDFPVTISDFTDVTGVDRENAAGVKYFTITSSGLANDDTIAAGQTKTFMVTVVCNATSASTINENFTISFKANAQ